MTIIGTTIADWEICKTHRSPTADYGDAPDPTFPSLFASGGPFHLDVNDCYVGWTATAEADALISDQDSDDGIPLIFATNSPGFWTGWVYVPITIDQSAPNVNRYLNVLLDCDSSGTWCNQPGEWVVRNYKVYYLPGQTYWYCIGGFSWVTFYSGMHWLRVTVSDSKVTANVPNGWDGSDTTGDSGFNRGETEDWLLQWHYSPHEPIPPNDPNDPPGPTPIPPEDDDGNKNKPIVPFQWPPPTHRGHAGKFWVGVKNLGNEPIHITEGPIVTGPWGDPITINVDNLICTWIPPGGVVWANASWEFGEDAPNKAWCDFDVVGDPEEQYVIFANVGDYISPTSDESTGGVFEERLTNEPPNKPIIEGQTSGKAGEEYEYTFVTTDPEEDDVNYTIDWGDGSDEVVIGPYESGEEATAKHSWDEEGAYTIRAKAEDDWDGAESNWATLEVSMPKNKAINTPFLQFLENHPHMFPLLRQIMGF